MSVHKILCDETAFVEIIIYEHSGGDYTTQTYNLKGQFSVAGEATSAEGDIEQVTSNYFLILIHYINHTPRHSVKDTESFQNQPIFRASSS